MKREIIVIGSCLILAGCGSQNLGPLEDKTTQLRDDNHQLKLKIQELNSDVASEKEKVNALNQDKNNKKKAASNNKEVKFLDSSSKYYQQVTEAIQKYNKLDLNSKKSKEKNLNELSKIDNQITSAYSDFQSGIEEKKLSSDNKTKLKNIKSINKDLNKAFEDIQSGYANSNNKKLKQGQNKLSQINLSTS